VKLSTSSFLILLKLFVELISLSKKSFTFTSKESKESYKHTHKRYLKARVKYINFLKSNSMWNDELEEKYNPKVSNNILKMDSFDEDFIVRYTRAQIQKKNNKLFSNKSKIEYGYDKKKSYEFYLELLNIIEEICRTNKWTSREDWVQHNLPMNKFIKGYIKASINYCEILKYYAKKRFDIRQSVNMGR